MNIFKTNKTGLAIFTALMLQLSGLSGYADDGGGQNPAQKATTEVSAGGGSGTMTPDLFTGTMSYSIPIDVPPGRNGMAPDINLLYRSGNGNGWLGVGWELEMGSIVRSLKNGVDYNGDDYQLRISGAALDLVYINGEYQTKIEGAFYRIKKLTASDGKSYWEVTDKKGTKYLFGQSAFTRQDNPSDSNQIFRWCLEYVVDTDGNYMTLTYTKEQGQIYLDRIDYTGNGSTAPSNYVKFNLQGRNDASDMYTTGFRVRTASQLGWIDVVANGDRVRAYGLAYIPSQNSSRTEYSHITGRAILAYVVRYGNDTATGWPTIGFTYTSANQANGIQDGEWGGISNYWSPSGYTWVGDFDGDGRSDVATRNNYLWVWRPVAGGMFTEGRWTENDGNWGEQSKTWVGDYNGDGKTDIATASGGNIWVKRSTGNSFVEEPWATTASNWGTNGTWIGDFDGDGKTDIATASGGTIYVKHSTGSSFNEEPWSVNGSNWGTTGTWVGDFNGDGKTDIATASGGNIWVKRSTGNSFVEESWATNAGNWGGSGYTWAGDFNSDGKTDIATASGGNIWVKLSTGFTFIEETWSTTASNWGGSGYTKVGDFNNDGRMDIATASGGTVWVKRSTGYSFIEETWTTAAGSWGGSDYTWAGDFNGDGKTDIATASGGTMWVKQSNAFSVDLLTKIYNGIGGATTIAYTPSTEYVNTQLPFPVQVVSSLTVCDDASTSTCNGTTSTISYSYYSGFYHIGKKDFRGFKYVKTEGPAGPNGEQAISMTWFHQGDDVSVGSNNLLDANGIELATKGYTKGKPYKVWVTDGTGNKYSETTTSYAADNTAPYFNPPNEINTSICDGDTCGKQMRVVYDTYDLYGNIIQVSQYGDINDSADDRTVTKSYGYNTTSWIVGLPTNESVYQGIGTSTKMAGTDYYYDEVSDCNTASTNQVPTKGKLTRIVRWLNGGTYPETRMAYDSYGNLTCSRDANGNTTTITYDGSYTFPRIATNPLNHQVTTQYYGIDGVAADKGLYGQVKSVTDPNNAATSYEYDLFGRKTKANLPDGSWNSWSYYNFGVVGSQNIRTDTSAGLHAQTFFDGLGRTIAENKTGPDSKEIKTSITYDSRGLVSQATLPYFNGLEAPRWKSYTYDPIGRVTGVNNPDLSRTLACYNDWVSVTIDENSHKRRETRDAYGRLINVEEYTGTYGSCDTSSGTPYATTTYQYDVLGNLRYVTDAKANQTEMRYDTLNRKAYMHDPDMGNWSYYYDANGNMTSQLDSMNQWIYFQYDALNRLRQKDYSNQKDLGTGDIVYNYDELNYTQYAKGRLTSMRDQSGTAVIHYDLMGRVIRELKTVTGTTYTTQYGYDQLGRPNAATYPDNTAVNYNYNGPLLSSVYDGSTTYAAYSGYNSLGQPGNITYGNGVTTGYTYYADNYRLNTINTTKSGATYQNMTYGYDNIGNITSITDYTDNNQTHEADKIARLNSLNTAPYTYNSPNGVRPHAVRSAGGSTYHYDNNGNMTIGAGRTITYDPENRPMAINASGTSTIFYYDGNGERVKKATGPTTTVYIGSLYECTNGSCTKYIFANGQRIAAKTNTNTFYYHTDHLGGSSVITDNNGNEVEYIAYYPFGQTRIDDGSTDTPYKYTGQELDDSTGLYNYNARLYDPVLGRFITADSIIPDPGDPQSFNRYSYVRNNPINYIDPTGHSWLSDALGIDIHVEDEIQKGVNWVNEYVVAPIENQLNEWGINVEDTEVNTSVDSNGDYSVSGNAGNTGSAGYETSLTLCAMGTCVGGASTTYGNSNPGYLNDNYSVYDGGSGNSGGGHQLTLQQGQSVVDVAKTYEGTTYKLIGAQSSKGTGGDCSGLTCAIYKEAGYPYPYSRAADLPKNGHFLNVTGTPQPGDVAWWPNHVAIYAPNLSDGNNLWTARREGFKFGQGSTSWWKKFGNPVFYRYVTP